MSDEQLRREVLSLLREAARRGESPRATDVLAQAQKQWNADEFAVREAIWNLLTTDQIDLTAERKLRPVAEVNEPVMV